jgi:hypothetical protein
MDTVFTYQGQLNHGGNPLNATADFQFTLFDALAGPNQIGSMLPVNNVTITEGVFTVPIDFGASAFDGSARFLQIAVRSPAGSGAFTTLTPRQQLTATPYALHTRGIFVDEAGHVGIGTTDPREELHIASTGATLRLEDTTTPGGGYTLIYDAQPTQLRFSKTNNIGQVLFDMNPLPADGVSNATVRFFRETDTTGGKAVNFLRGDGTNTSSASIGVDGVDSFFQIHGGNVGIRTTAPDSPLHVYHNGNSYALHTVHQGNVFGGGILAEVLPNGNTNTHYAGYFVNHNFNGSGVSEYAVYAESHGSAGAALRAEAVETSSNNVDGVVGVTHSPGSQCTGVTGRAEASTGSAVGVYGLSSSVDGYDFYAAGAGENYGSASSIRWKRNIEAIEDPLDMLIQLRGVYFDWDTEHGRHHDIGCIAEEVGAVLPEIVNYEENGIDANGMDYSKLTPLLVEAVKALRAEKDQQIQEKDAEIAALQTRLDKLERDLKRLTTALSQGN